MSSPIPDSENGGLDGQRPCPNEQGAHKSRSVLEFNADVQAVGRSRVRIAEWVQQCCCCERIRRDDVVLAASELLSNVFEHGSDIEVEVSIEVSVSNLVMSVSSKTDRDKIPAISRWDIPAPEADSGRGLGVLRALADDVTVLSTPVKTTIQLEFIHTDPTPADS